jgi:hypothetical protein
MRKLIVDFRNFAKAHSKREERRARAVSGHTDGRAAGVLIERQGIT